MDLKVVCQKKEANEKNAPSPFIHCSGKTPGTNRLKKVTASSYIARYRVFGEWGEQQKIGWCIERPSRQQSSETDKRKRERSLHWTIQTILYGTFFEDLLLALFIPPPTRFLWEAFSHAEFTAL